MKYITTFLLLAVIVFWGQPLTAKVDLVTLPDRDTTQLTIYNSADLTLVRDGRALTFKEGHNRLQFSWANTLIDPTSLEMIPKKDADKIDIFDLTFPPRINNTGVWHINSSLQGKLPVEITYLTSGITWRAFYMGTLSTDEKTMRLTGYVRVTNNSGEDYENAQVRLIVGKVHLLDQIAMLARKKYPYGRPGVALPVEERVQGVKLKRAMMDTAEAMPAVAARIPQKKEIVKEGLSEYFLYTIEGEETIPSGWSKRLPSFEALKVPVINLYKYEKERYGNRPVRFVGFKNDKIHKLGETPIPGGILKVFRQVDDAGHLTYEGQSAFKYIPVDEEVELSLGAVDNVIITPVLMDYRTDHYTFDQKSQITGWDEIRTFRCEVKNTRSVAIKLEIKRHYKTNYWDLQNNGDYGTFEKEDKDSVKYTLALAPRSSKVFDYILTTYHGDRQDNH